MAGKREGAMAHPGPHLNPPLERTVALRTLSNRFAIAILVPNFAVFWIEACACEQPAEYRYARTRSLFYSNLIWKHFMAL